MADNSLPKTSTEARKWEIYTLSDPRDGVVRYVGVSHIGRKRYNRLWLYARLIIDGKPWSEARRAAFESRRDG